MKFYFREDKTGVLHLYYDVTDAQLEHIITHQYKQFPVRFFTKKFFCPMLSKEYAQRTASERVNWLSEKTTHIHVLRFLVNSHFIARYTNGQLTNEHARIAIPHADLIKLNQNIIGYIERIESIDLTSFC